MKGHRPWRDAIEAYRRGHDRVWENERMRPLPSPADSEETEWAGAPPPPRFGIPVSELLDFHRGPDTWRSREASGGQRAGRD